MGKIDLAIVNANIITMDERDSRAQAIALSGDRILKVGSESEIRKLTDKDTYVIDLDGKTVIPGLMDTHMHNGVPFKFDAAWTRSIEELQKKITLWTLQVPKERYIGGSRFEPMQLKEKRWPIREELDKVSPDHYLSLSLWGGHGCVVNTKLLKAIEAEIPPNERERVGGIEKDPKTGEPTGVLVEADAPLISAQHYMNAVIQKRWPLDNNMWSSNEEITRQNYIITAEEAAKVGLTTCHVAGTNEFSTRFLLSQPLSVRFVPYFIIWEENNLDEKLTLIKKLSIEYNERIGVKIFNDGDFNPHTAALFEPYTDRPSTRGVLLSSQEDLNRFVLKLHKEGFQIACHCCGERCVGAIQDAYEYALKKAPRSDHRHRVEHAELVTKDLMQQAAKLGVAWAMQPNFLFYLDYTPYIGEERMKRVHPYKDILDAGVLVAAGTDCGVTPMDPILGIHILVNHRNPEQRISVKDALRLHTVNAAKIGFEEKEKGSLEPGKLADLVVLSDDPYKVPPNKIREIQVVLTMMGGRITYRNARLLEKYP